MVGVSITITLKDEEKEKIFLEIFQRALEKVNFIPKLKEFQASKVIGKEFTYHVFMLWEDEDAIEEWLSNPTYKEIRRKGREDLIKEFISYRWKPIKEPRVIKN